MVFEVLPGSRIPPYQPHFDEREGKGYKHSSVAAQNEKVAISETTATEILRDRYPAVIVLSEEFWKEILWHPIPAASLDTNSNDFL
jgi:hypothetical protein